MQAVSSPLRTLYLISKLKLEQARITDLQTRVHHSNHLAYKLQIWGEKQSFLVIATAIDHPSDYKELPSVFQFRCKFHSSTEAGERNVYRSPLPPCD